MSGFVNSLISLKSQASCTGRFGQGLDPPVVLVAAAVENDLADAAGLGLLRHELANDLCRRHVAAAPGLSAEIGRPAVHRQERPPGRVVHHLSIDVVEAAEDGQPGPFCRALRKPDPYKGKGIKYADEHIRRKVGKKAGAK